MNFRRVLFALPLLAAACGGGGSSVSQNDFVGQYISAYCTKLISCCPGTSGLPTQSSCVASVQANFGTLFDAAFADSKINFNSSAAASCLSEVNAGACSSLVYPSQLAQCSLVFSGTVANGGSCAVSDDQIESECQSGLCGSINYPSGSNNGTGTCTAVGASGGACSEPVGVSEGDECAAGTYDDFSGAGCVCTPLKGNGVACMGDGDCASSNCDSTTNPSSPVCATPPAALTQDQCKNLISEN